MKLRLSCKAPFEIELRCSLENELQGSLKLSCKTLLKLSYKAPELHGSLATWPSRLSGSL